MTRQPVSSSNVASVGYEANEFQSGTLEVEFTSGAVYQYTGVPQREFDSLIHAVSVGKYLRSNITGRYPSTKL